MFRLALPAMLVSALLGVILALGAAEGQSPSPSFERLAPTETEAVERARALEREAARDYESGERAWRALIALQEARTSSVTARCLASVDDLASSLRRQRRFAEAEALSSRCHQAFQREYGARHFYTLAEATALALAIGPQGRNSEAQSIRAGIIDAALAGIDLDGVDTERLAAYRAFWPGDGRGGSDASQALDEVTYGILLEAHEYFLGTRGEGLAAGSRAQRRIYELLREHFGPNDPNVAQSMNQLAEDLVAQRHYDEAGQIWLSALEAVASQESAPALEVRMRIAESMIGRSVTMEADDCEGAQALRAAAAPVQRDAERGQARIDGLSLDELPQTPACRDALAASVLDEAKRAETQGDLGAAQRLYRRVVAFRRAWDNDLTATADAEEALGVFLMRQGAGNSATSLSSAFAWRVRSFYFEQESFRSGITYDAPPQQESAANLHRVASATLAALVASGPSEDHTSDEPIFLAAQMSSISSSSTALSMRMAMSVASERGGQTIADAWREAYYRLAELDASLVNNTEQAQARRRERATLFFDVWGAENELRQFAPDIHALAIAPAVRLRETQALLHEDEVLLVLTAGNVSLPAGFQRGSVVALTREAMEWAPLAMAPEELLDEIARLHAELEYGGATRAPGQGTAAQAMSGARAFNLSRAHRLYQALFGAPRIEALVRNKERWTLAPQGALLSMPFAALVSEAPDARETATVDPETLRRTSWLGLNHTLSVTPSIVSLRAQPQEAGEIRARDRNVTFFGVGDPAFEGAPVPVTVAESDAAAMSAVFNARGADVAAVRALRRLPHTRVEIESLAHAFGAAASDYLLGEAATERELAHRADRLAQANVIAFATHGLIAGDLGGTLAEPALALTPPLEASAGDDGLLTASEVARLRLNAPWVILSACNTAAGGRPDAEGLTGLARAFFYAGARTLLVSQWPVNDEAAQRLTTRAIERERSENLSPAESMRRSMRELMEDRSRDGAGRSFAHPSAWAPFILVGGG
jgi:CHAT domain-containing protein